MRLSTKGKYALIAMAYIARKDFNSNVSVSEISNETRHITNLPGTTFYEIA